MEEDPFKRTSPTVTVAIQRLSADLDDPYVRLYRAVIEEDIRVRLSKDADDENEGDEEEEGDDEDDEDIDPRKRIILDRDPIEYHIYEVCAQRHGDSVRYWIYSADYVVEDGDSANIVNEEATRAEAIEHVQEACSYEDAENMEEDRVPLGWSSRDANGNKTIDFPEDDEVFEYLMEEEEYL